MFNRRKNTNLASTTIEDLLEKEKQYQESFKQAYTEAQSFRMMIQSVHSDILARATKEKYYEPLSKLQDIYQIAHSRHQDWVEFYYITLFCSDGTAYTFVDKGASLFYLATSDNDPMAALIAALAPNKSLAGKLTYSYATEKQSFQLDIFSGELRILSTDTDGPDAEVYKHVEGFANLQLHPRGIKDWDNILNKKKDLNAPLPADGMIPFFKQLSLVFETNNTISADFFSNDPRDNSSVKLTGEMQDAVDAVDRALSKVFDKAIDAAKNGSKISLTKDDIKKEIHSERAALKQEKRDGVEPKTTRSRKPKVYDA